MVAVEVRQRNIGTGGCAADGLALGKGSFTFAQHNHDFTGTSATRRSDCQVELSISIKVSSHDLPGGARQMLIHGSGKFSASQSSVKRYGRGIDGDQVEDTVIVEVSISDPAGACIAGVDSGLSEGDLRCGQSCNGPEEQKGKGSLAERVKHIVLTVEKCRERRTLRC